MTRTALVLLLAAAALAACRDGDGACEGAGCCATSRDCPGWETCGGEGRCVPAPACSSDSGCAAGDVCGPSRWCDTPARLDPTRIAIVGAIRRDGAAIGVAPLDQPTRVIAGLFNQGDSSAHAYALDGLGRVLYLETHITYENGSPRLSRTVRRLVADPWTWDGYQWHVMGPVRENDEPVPTACPPSRMVGRPGTAEVYYGCDDGNAYGPSGELVAEGAEPLAVNAAGTVLLLQDGLLALRRPGDVARPAPRSPELRTVLTARARGDGFWVLEDVEGRARRWVVEPDGGVSGGDFLPSRSSASCVEGAIDPDGAAYRPSWGLDAANRLAAGVERCTPARCERAVALPELGPIDDVRGRPPRRTVDPVPPLPTVITGP